MRRWMKTPKNQTKKWRSDFITNDCSILRKCNHLVVSFIRFIFGYDQCSQCVNGYLVSNMIIIAIQRWRKKPRTQTVRPSDSQTEVVDDDGITQFGGCLMLLWQIKQASNANDGITCHAMIFVRVRNSMLSDQLVIENAIKITKSHLLVFMCRFVITNHWSLCYKHSVKQSVEMN